MSSRTGCFSRCALTVIRQNQRDPALRDLSPAHSSIIRFRSRRNALDSRFDVVPLADPDYKHGVLGLILNIGHRRSG